MSDVPGGSIWKDWPNYAGNRASLRYVVPYDGFTGEPLDDAGQRRFTVLR